MLKVGIFGLDSQLVNVVDGGGQNVSQLKIDDDVILLYASCFMLIDADADKSTIIRLSSFRVTTISPAGSTVRNHEMFSQDSHLL